MKQYIGVSLSVLLAGMSFASGGTFTTCSRYYEKLGCFQEAQTQMDLIVTDRDLSSPLSQGHLLDWSKFKESIHSLACRCSQKAKANGYTYFSIRFWAECWAGKGDPGALQNVLKGNEADSCRNHNFKACDDNDVNECVGTDRTGYIFAVMPPVDGGYSVWPAFTVCSKKCGGGWKSRSRSCNNPKPAFGGKNCSGPSGETIACNVQSCPVNGGFSVWSSFSSCSKTCGGGEKSRFRGCDNPKPAYGGKNCIGSGVEHLTCNKQQCPVNGGFSAWSGFGGCSRTCGGGIQSRSRSCSNPAPVHGGTNCVGQYSQQRRCNAQSCVCRNYRYLGHRKQCGSNVYTRQGGRCDGWAYTSFNSCKEKCNRNEAPNGCGSRKCEYVIWDTNPGTPPGWCQLATKGCRITGANAGHALWVKSC